MVQSKRDNDMKKIFKLFLIGIAILAFVGSLLVNTSVYAFPQGIDGRSQSGCGPCHDPSVSTTVTIIGLPVAYEPGRNYSLTVNVASAVSSTWGGFDLSVTAGTLVITDAVNTQLSGTQELYHTDAGKTQRSWNFNWTAPAAGDVTFYVAGLAADASASAAGDEWETNSYTFSIIPEFPGLMLIAVLIAIAIPVIILLQKRKTAPKSTPNIKL